MEAYQSWILYLAGKTVRREIGLGGESVLKTVCREIRLEGASLWGDRLAGRSARRKFSLPGNQPGGKSGCGENCLEGNHTETRQRPMAGLAEVRNTPTRAKALSICTVIARFCSGAYMLRCREISLEGNHTDTRQRPMVGLAEVRNTRRKEGRNGWKALQGSHDPEEGKWWPQKQFVLHTTTLGKAKGM